MRHYDLIIQKIFIISVLLLGSYSLSAQTLESSVPPAAALTPVQQPPTALPSEVSSTPLLPSGDQLAKDEDEEPQVKGSSALPEVQVIEDPSKSGFGMSDVEDTIENLLSKKKITGALVGTTISAALSAHPLGAFLGGLVGAMVGKESKYQAIELPSSALAQQNLFRDLERGQDLQLVAMPDEVAPTPSKSSMQQQTIKQSSTLAAVSPRLDANNPCYQDTKQDQPRDRASLRHCFYYMY